MSRAKQYDRIDLLNKAVELFRRQGFNGTSTAELVEELGVNRKSMYAEFGSKQELFESVLEHYNRSHLTRVLKPVEAEDASLEGIRQAFYLYSASIEGSFRGLSCLMGNTAVERAPLDPGSARYVDEYLARITTAFRRALSNAQNNGEIKPSINLDDMAGFLTTTLLGIIISVRAKAPTEQVWAAYRVVMGMIDDLEAQA